MGGDIGNVAVGAPEVHGYAVLAIDGQNEEQLLEIGPMILASMFAKHTTAESLLPGGRGARTEINDVTLPRVR